MHPRDRACYKNRSVTQLALFGNNLQIAGLPMAFFITELPREFHKLDSKDGHLESCIDRYGCMQLGSVRVSVDL